MTIFLTGGLALTGGLEEAGTLPAGTGAFLAGLLALLIPRTFKAAAPVLGASLESNGRLLAGVDFSF